jgi:hypothetical protein
MATAYQVTDTIESDWLHQIDGLSVADAIAYLQTLDPSLRLNAFCDGEDLHGIELGCSLLRDRDQTPEEAKAARLKYLNRELTTYTSALQRYTKENRQEGVDRATSKLAAFNAEISKLTGDSINDAPQG